MEEGWWLHLARTGPHGLGGDVATIALIKYVGKEKKCLYKKPSSHSGILSGIYLNNKLPVGVPDIYHHDPSFHILSVSSHGVQRSH